MTTLLSTYLGEVIKNGLGCTLGSLFAIAITVLIYKLTFRDHEREKKELAERNERETLEYFSQATRNVLQVAEDQNAAIKAFADALRATPYEYPLMSFYPLFEFKRIVESQSLDKTFLAYTNKFKEEEEVVKQFRSIVTSIEFLYAQFLWLPDHAKNGQTFDYGRKMEIKNIFADAFSVLGRYMANIVNYQAPQPFEVQFMNAMDAYNNALVDNSDLTFYYQYFFEPIQAVLQPVLSAGHRPPILLQLAELTRNGIQVYESIPTHNAHLAGEFDEVHESIEEGIIALKEAAEKLLAI